LRSAVFRGEASETCKIKSTRTGETRHHVFWRRPQQTFLSSLAQSCFFSLALVSLSNMASAQTALDLHGKSMDPLHASHGKITVLIFALTELPHYQSLRSVAPAIKKRPRRKDQFLVRISGQEHYR